MDVGVFGACTHVGLPLRGLAPHEGVGHAVLGAALAVAGLVVALELAGAPAGVQRAAAAAVLPQLHVVVDHVVWVCNATGSLARDSAAVDGLDSFDGSLITGRDG